MMPLSRLFIVTVFVSLMFQGWMWKVVPLVDLAGWSERAHALAVKNYTIFDMPFFTNPDAAMLEVAAITQKWLGVSPVNSVRGSVALLDSIAIGGIVVVAYLLRPNSPWWFVAGSVAIFNDAYMESAPHDAIAALYITLAILISIFLYERSGQNVLWAATLGIASGVAMATWLPLSLMLLGPMILFLLPKLSKKQAIAVLFATVAGFIIFDPLFRKMPFEHLQMMLSQTLYHTSKMIEPKLPLVDFITVAPLPLLSVGMAIMYIAFPARLPQPMPRKLLFFLLLVTASFVSVLLSANYQTFRSFAPLIFIWGILFPLFLFNIIRSRQYLRSVSILLIIEQILSFGVALAKLRL